MDVNEVKKTLENYNELEIRARDVLQAGDIRFGGIDSIVLAGDDLIEINYWVTCHGETFHEEECVPAKMLADGADLNVEWEKLRELREKRRKLQEANAKRAAKRKEKAEAKAKIKEYLAEINRLKEKYPGMFNVVK